MSPGTTCACAFCGRAALITEGHLGRDLIPENAPGAEGKKIPQLAAQPLHKNKNLHSCREFGQIFLPQSTGSY